MGQTILFLSIKITDPSTPLVLYATITPTHGNHEAKFYQTTNKTDGKNNIDG